MLIQKDSNSSENTDLLVRTTTNNNNSYMTGDLESGRRMSATSSGSSTFYGKHSGSTNPTRNKVVYNRTIWGKKYQLTLHQLQYLTFVLIGVALLWPWNCFLSASEYYTTRFTKTNGESYARIYSSTMMSVSTIAQLAFNYYLSERQNGANYYKRFISGQVVNSLIFLIMAGSCVAFLGIKPGPFFALLMVMILGSSLCCCSSQNGSMAIVNIYGPLYAQGLMVGQAIAGVLPSISLIASIIIVGEKPQVEHVEKNYGVMTYYLTSTVVSCLSLVGFLAFIYKYAFEGPSIEDHDDHHHYVQLVDESGDVDNQLIEENEEEFLARDEEGHHNNSQHVPFSYLFSKLNSIVITLVLVFVVSLIFPVFASNIESVNKPAGEDISNGIHFSNSNIFIPLAFMVWNIGDLVGRVVCGYEFFQIHNEKAMLIYSIARSLFIPFLFMCNLNDSASSSNNHGSPLLNSDVVYLFIQFMYGATNGHLCSNCFMNVGPKFTKDQEKKAAGGFTTVFLSIGLAVGSVCSYIFVALIG
ncbi:nucleoside transmembrane transporter [Saccharomycopsis crataegensis]|uniref:Nucleoside transmembrane transporter n=1 Tax=Saccharomycopsis crataegensis TaxID=43959 RepID=A0AAV5QVE4_9ASCO|nr:nucleoside transmembrane transporter [Saccharomycopsis crataegensis]